MQDRVSQYPGRIKLVPVSGQENVYDMEWADGASVLGTPINKNTLLKDATAALFGLGSGAVPDDVLVEVRSLITTVQNAANTAQNTANGRARVVVGSYVGNGTTSKTLNFGLSAKIVVVSGPEAIFGSTGSSVHSNIVVLPRDITSASISGAIDYQYSRGFSISWSATGLTMKVNGTASPGEALNLSGTTYRYAAVG